MSPSPWMLSLSLGFVLGFPCPAPACRAPWEETGPTFIEDFKQASIVLFGKCVNVPLPESEIPDGGITEFVIERVFKAHKVLENRKVITLAPYLFETNNKCLIFCDVYKGKIDPFRRVEVKSDDIIKYLEGALKIKQKSISARLRYCFDYLDNAEKEIALDAYRQFAVADYKDLREMARNLPPDKIAGWLTDPKTPAEFMGLYALLLGHCGKDRHVKILRELLGCGIRSTESGIDYVVVAYTLLTPKEGWAHLRDGMLSNPKEDFQVRYAGLCSIRFLWDNWPGVVARKDLVQAICLLLDQTDIADLAIEELRTHKCWQVADQVLTLAKKESHNSWVIQKAVLRYALSCPPRVTKAIEIIKAEREKDKEYVADVEELLKSETEDPSKKPIMVPELRP